MVELTRRQAILTAMSTNTVMVTGCVTESDDNLSNDGSNSERGEGRNDDTGGSDDSDTDDATNLSIIDSSIVNQWSDCANGDAKATVVRDGAEYLIDGLAMAPNPCHEAVLRDINTADGDLRVSVDIAHSELGENEECVECHGAVGYNVLTEIEASDSVERVLVSHGAEEFEILHEEFSTDPFVYDTEIETVEAECGESDIDEASVSLEDGALTVNGRLSASNPCQEAQLDDLFLVGGEMNVEVSLTARETGDEDSSCTNCVGEIAYEVTANLINDELVEAIVVKHADGENHQF